MVRDFKAFPYSPTALNMPRNHIKSMEREVSRSSEHKGIKHFAQINSLAAQSSEQMKPVTRNLGDLRMALTTRGVRVSQ